MKKIKFLQLCLAIERDLIVGGQAVMEGVMMRTPNAYAIACRRSDGSISYTSEKLPKWSDKHKILGTPILRGGATLIQSLALGVKALNFSAKIAQEDMEKQEAKEKAGVTERESALAEGVFDEDFTKSPAKMTLPNKKRTVSKIEKTKQSASAIVSIMFALCFNIFLFIVAPLLLTNALFILLGLAPAPDIIAGANWWASVKAYVWEVKPESWLAFNLIDGLIRMVFFVVMIFSMSFLKDIHRVFQYHGAEHKTVFAWEKGLNLKVKNAHVQKRQHPRCGTSFLMVVMLVAIILFSVINFEQMWLNFVVRVILMPLVAGLSYEIIRYAAKKESSSIFKFITMPGIWLQNITTQEPDSDQLEVAIKALNESLKLEPQAA